MLRYRWHLCVLNSFAGYSARAKTPSFSTRRSWFGPVRNCGKSAVSGGAAGYCPRVRCTYCTAQFIAIAGRNRHALYSAAQLNVKWMGWEAVVSRQWAAGKRSTAHCLLPTAYDLTPSGLFRARNRASRRPPGAVRRGSSSARPVRDWSARRRSESCPRFRPPCAASPPSPC